MNNIKMILPDLPYAYDALEPVISRQIMQLHHDKHHLAYINGANAAMEKLDRCYKGELEINVREVERDLSFNYNGAILHDIFWHNMRAAMENNRPDGIIATRIDEEFGSFENFVKVFGNTAKQVEGSGWAVLWKTPDHGLMVSQLEKHNLLGLNGAKPLLILDVWEHAYYPDYLNDRGSYVDKWWMVVNWDDVDQRLK